MIRQGLYIPDLDWELTVYYESTSKDADRILHTLSVMGCDDETYFKASKMLDKGDKNCGLTYSNLKAKESVIVLSKTTSDDEFANTWFHEVVHCAVHIATALGLDYQGETMAYIGGDLAAAMHPVAARLMCPTCR